MLGEIGFKISTQKNKNFPSFRKLQKSSSIYSDFVGTYYSLLQ